MHSIVNWLFNLFPRNCWCRKCYWKSKIGWLAKSKHLLGCASYRCVLCLMRDWIKGNHKQGRRTKYVISSPPPKPIQALDIILLSIVHTSSLPWALSISVSVSVYGYLCFAVEPNKFDTCVLLCAFNAFRTKWIEKYDEFNVFNISKHCLPHLFESARTGQYFPAFITKLWHERCVLLHPLKCTEREKERRKKLNNIMGKLNIMRMSTLL